MTERRMTEVVSERDRFGQIFVQRQTPRNGTRYLRHVESVRKTRHVVVAFGREENLRFVLQSAERFGINYSVSVALKFGTHRARLFFSFSAFRIFGKTRESGKIRALFFVRFLFCVEQNIAHRKHLKKVILLYYSI